MPLFWTDAELTGLQGTEIQDCATSDRQAPMWVCPVVFANAFEKECKSPPGMLIMLQLLI